MSSKDLHTLVQPGTAFGVKALALNPTTISTNTLTVGATVNTQLFEGLEFFVFANTRTDGTYTPSLEDSDDGTNWTAVDPNFVIGDSVQQAVTAAHVPSYLGYVGKKQFVRIAITSTLVTSGASLVALATLGWPNYAPTDTAFVPSDEV